MPLNGTKDKYFSFFHSSCQLGLKGRVLFFQAFAFSILTDEANDNNEILGYICCIMVPIFSAMVSIWTRQCKKVEATVVMFWVSFF